MMASNDHISNMEMVGVDYPKIILTAKQKETCLETSEDAFNLVKQFTDKRNEYCLCISTNEDDYPISVRVVSIGGRSEATISIPNMTREVLRENASGIIIVHNHPVGDCLPSKVDLEFIRDVKAAANAVGIELVDAIIIGPGGYQSMLAPLKKDDNDKTRFERYILPTFPDILLFSKTMKVIGLFMVCVVVIDKFAVTSGEAMVLLMFPAGWMAEMMVGVVRERWGDAD